MSANLTTTLPGTVGVSTSATNMSTSELPTTSLANSSPAFPTADPAGSMTPPKASFWDTYQVYLLAGGAALLVAIIVILYLCLRRRRQRAKRRLPGSNLEASLDDALPLETLKPARAIIDSSPTHLQPSAVAAAPSAAFAHDVVPLTLAEPEEMDGDLTLLPITTPLMDQWAPAHEQGYTRPSAVLEELRTAVADNETITIIPDGSIKVRGIGCPLG